MTTAAAQPKVGPNRVPGYARYLLKAIRHVRRHYWKNSPTRPACDAECKKRMICDLRSGRSHDRKALCQEIESRIDAGSRISWSAWLYNGFTASYVSLLSVKYFWVPVLVPYRPANRTCGFALKLTLY